MRYNSRLDGNDKFAKVRLLIIIVNDACLKNFLPQQTISVDESMVPCFGRHGAKQYIRGKPSSLDIKCGWRQLPKNIAFRPFASLVHLMLMLTDVFHPK